MYWSDIAWLIPVFPLLAFVIVGFFGKKMKEGGAWIAIGLAIVSCFLSILVAIEVLTGGVTTPYVYYLNWITIGSFQFNVGIYLDSLTALMLIVVSVIATLVVIYSVGYMHEEGDRKRRYYAEISLFIGVMLGLVLSSNFLEMFIFWELVGLCSYLLIGFWFTKPAAASAAKKAFLVTRVGDIMFMIGLMILFVGVHNLDYTTVLNPSNWTGSNMLLTLATFFLFGGAIGKSAQFPLHDWLPDAMEGPTPVSALIHAATMVNAGIYLVARSYPLLVQTPNTLLIIAIIGGFTAFFAATMALNNMNIKRVLAYSTISQLGYMLLALGAGGYIFAVSGQPNAGYSAAMLHLLDHAFFKALLFLSAGAVIHAVHTEDMRLMGGLRKKLKITSFVMLIGCISISGIPPFSGFWSKDDILSVTFQAGATNPAFYVLWVLGVVTAFMTAFYMFRLWFMTFCGEPRSHEAEHAHESPKIMTVPMMILAVFATVSGLVILFNFGQVMVPVNVFTIASESALSVLADIFTSWLTYVSLLAASSGILLAYFVYYKHSIDSSVFVATPFRQKLSNMLTARYGFKAGYDLFATKIVSGIAKVVDIFDRRVIDGLINLIGVGTLRGGNRLRRAQTGFVQTYAAVVVVSVSLLVILLFFIGGVL